MTRTDAAVLSGIVTLSALVIAWDGCRPPRPVGAVYAEPECYRWDAVEREVEAVEEAMQAGECDDRGCPGEGE